MVARQIVFFDVDDTLVNCQTQQLLTKFLWQKRKISSLFVFKIYLWFFLYKIGLINDVDTIREESFKLLKGWKVSEFHSLLYEFFAEELEKRIFPHARALITQHKANGNEVILVSSSIHPLIRIIADFLRLSEIIATRLEVIGNQYTGRIDGPVVYGNAKAEMAKRIVESMTKPTSSVAYADHHSDIPLLDLVDRPIVVNPKKRLKEIAVENNWEIMHFEGTK